GVLQRSEYTHDGFFKPCQDSQELAFCLNEGECFIIETVAGVHRHCRCKEGYRGLRCDQFVPKTDSILSDPIVGVRGLSLLLMKSCYEVHRQLQDSCPLCLLYQCILATRYP
uniref:EGF-like domain-containing protein n=1 Tax=Electrophorus electricus TaxID=8005 RepID=A0AAY5E898_ELEEL